MRVLVSGGAGYIGSHTVLALIEAGHDVVIVDSFANSKPSVLGRLESMAGVPIALHAFDLTDRDKTEHLFAHEQIDAVIHFAGLKAVGESFEKPLEYYENNLESTFSLVRAMSRHGVHRLVFSSSATVYGDHAPVPYHEDYVPLSASNPYGRTKVMVEHVLRDSAPELDFRAALLRYFNPVGAHESGTLGEDPRGTPNNLMPYIAQVAVGKRARLQVFGNDYDTADGTGVRDYLHVVDLAEGHVAALRHLLGGARSLTVNLGTGRGSSVLELVHAFERASGRPVPYEIVARRPGDVAACYADPALAERTIGWKATRDLDRMCADTWRWQAANPNGFGS
jgi:UDP-glucose 4-epimerase